MVIIRVAEISKIEKHISILGKQIHKLANEKESFKTAWITFETMK